MARQKRAVAKYFHYNNYVISWSWLLYLCTARVAPIDVSASPSVRSTNVHWKFDRNVEKEIKSFKVNISPDTCSNDRDAPPSARTKTLFGLESGVTHNVKVVAIYSDTTRSKSTTISFTTPGIYVMEIIDIIRYIIVDT